MFVIILTVSRLLLYFCYRLPVAIFSFRFYNARASFTGVPKLNRAELETACEDFSNIIYTRDGVATLYKGTLSSGVEIAVVSTAINSTKEWSKRSELAFRKKVR